jgi:WD40 repeat protein
LAEAQEILQTRGGDLGPGIKDFILASTDHARRRHRRTLRITQAVAAGFAIIAVVAGGAGWIAWQNRQVAEQARNEAVGQRDTALRSESFFLSAVSLKLTRSGNPIGGAQLARAALPGSLANPDRPVVPEAVSALAGALAEIGPLRGTVRHSSTVFGGFLKDGTIATLAAKTPLRISRAPFGEKIATFGWPNSAFAWASENGDRIAVREGEQIRFFDRKSGKQIALTDLSVRGEPLFRTFLNGDLSLAAALYAPAGGKLLSLPSGRLVKTFGAGTVIAWAAFSAKSDKLLWTSIEGSFVDELRHRSAPIALGPLTAYPAPAAISAGADLVVVGCKDGVVRLWNLASAKGPTPLLGNTAQILFVGFDPSSRHVFSISKDKVLRSWSVSRQQPEFNITDVMPDAGLAITPDGRRFAVAGPNHEIRIYDAMNGREVSHLAGHGAPITGLSFSPDGRYLLSTSTDRTARIWEPARVLGLAPADSSKSLSTVGFTSGNVPFAVDSNGTVSIWRSGTASPPIMAPTRTDFMHVVALDAKATVIGFSPLNDKAQLWALAGPTGPRQLALLSNLGMFATNVAISDDGSRVLMTGISGTALLLDGHTGALVAQVHQPLTIHGELSRDGRVALLWSFAKAWLRDGRTFAPIAAFSIGKNTTRLVLAPDGRSFLDIESDGRVSLRDGKGSVIRSLMLGDLRKASFSDASNGKWIAIVDEKGRATILDIERCAIAASGKIGAAAPQFVALSPNGQALSTQSKDGTVTLWSLPGFRPLLNFPEEWTGSSTAMQIAAFSADGRTLALRWHDNQIRLWPTTLSELLRRTDQTVPGPLTKQERTQLILSYE